MNQLAITLRLDGLDIEITSHAQIRYAERVLSGADIETTERNLCSLLPFATLEISKPQWAETTATDDTRNAGYLMIGPDVAFPLVACAGGGRAAVTCLTRGGLGETARKARTKRRRPRAGQPRHNAQRAGSGRPRQAYTRERNWEYAEA